MPQLIKKGIIVKTRKEGKANLFMFNRNSHVAMELNNFAREIDIQHFAKPKTSGFGVMKGLKPFEKEDELNAHT